MSIIHEALKKTQNNIKPAAKPEPAPVAPPVDTQEQPRPVEPQAPLTQNTLEKTAPSTAVKQSHPSARSTYSQKRTIGVALSTFVIIVVAFLLMTKKQIPSAQTNEPPVPSSPYNLITASPLEKKAAQAAKTSAGSTQTEITLQGISVTGTNKFALINGDIYEVGDEIYGKEIMNISENSVELSDGNQTVVLKTRRK